MNKISVKQASASVAESYEPVRSWGRGLPLGFHLNNLKDEFTVNN